MAIYKVTKSWSPDDTWSYKGKTFRSFYLDLEGDERRVQVNQVAEKDPIIPGHELDLDISTEKTSSGKFYKAKRIYGFDAKCPECGHEFKFSPETRSKQRNFPNREPLKTYPKNAQNEAEGVRSESEDDTQPPLDVIDKNYQGG